MLLNDGQAARALMLTRGVTDTKRTRDTTRMMNPVTNTKRTEHLVASAAHQIFSPSGGGSHRTADGSQLRQLLGRLPAAGARLPAGFQQAAMKRDHFLFVFFLVNITLLFTR